jgi:hypothetical protein
LLVLIVDVVDVVNVHGSCLGGRRLLGVVGGDPSIVEVLLLGLLLLQFLDALAAGHVPGDLTWDDK